MERTHSSFQAKKMTEDVRKRFGVSKNDVSIQMRQCDDVPRFIKKAQEAHELTASSNLRFGPSNCVKSTQ